MTAELITQLWDRIREGTVKTIDRFSDQDLDFTAFEGGYSVGEIIRHIAHEEYGEIQYGLTYELDEFPNRYADEVNWRIRSLKELLSETHVQTYEFLRSVNDSQLTAEFEAQWGERKPLFMFIVHVMEHEIHHRGELSPILGLLGREGLDA